MLTFGEPAQAYMDGAADVDAIDRRIAFYEQRRNLAFREMALYSEAKARGLDRSSRDIIDDEFTEAAE